MLFSNWIGFIFFIILGFCIYRCKKRNVIYSNIELGEVNLGATVEESV